MGIIDFPLTDGVHEENDNKLGKPSTLITCRNFYYDLIGRLAVRGGFTGAAVDDIATGTNGVPRHSVEVGGDLVLVTDTGVLKTTEAGTNVYSFDHSIGAYLESADPIPVASYTAAGGASLTGTGGAIAYAQASGWEYLGCGCYLYGRPIGQGSWTRLQGTANTNTVMLANVTTGSGPGIVAAVPRAGASDAWFLYYQGSVTNNGTVAGTTAGHDVISYGSDALIAELDATNVYIYFVRGNTCTLKVTYAHGIGAGPSAGYTPVRVQIAAVGTSCWVAFGMTNATNSAVLGAQFTIPADPTGAWSSVPADTGGGTLRTGTVLFSITNTGVTIEGWTDTTAGAASTYTIKWDMAANAEVAWAGNPNLAGVYARPAFVPCSRAFQPSGQSNWYVFAHACAWPEPGNALYLVRWAPANGVTLGEGEVVSVTGVQTTPTTTYGQPDMSGFDLHSPYLTADGSIVCGFNSKRNTGLQVPNLGTWRLCESAAAIKRNIASDGVAVYYSGAPYEYDSARSVPTICPITVWSVTAAGSGGTLAAGVHAVRYLIEVGTGSGIWQSAATLPRLVTTVTNDSIRCNLTISVNCWKASTLPWRVVAYVAPPGATTYYRSATFEPENIGGAKIATLSWTTASATCAVTSVDTTGELLYELAEPPHTYPGDAWGVAWANGRIWRWRGSSLWFTHSTVAGLATQWAGDVFRIDFNGDIQGVGQLQGQPVVIASDSVWLLGGDGPDRSGAGAYELRQLASVPLGCQDQRSIVETPAGLCWASVRGIEMIPAGGGVPVSVGQPVRETFLGLTGTDAPAGFVLGAHVQARSLAVWFCGNANPLDFDNAICFDYLRGVWFTWKVPYTSTGVITCAGSWGSSFAYYDYNASAAKSYGQFDCRLKGGALQTKYPVYSLDTAGVSSSGPVAGVLETGDVRVAGSNSNAIWRGAWLLGATGQTVATPGDVRYYCEQTADGALQTAQEFKQAGLSTERGWFRSMAQFPVSDADGVSAKITVTVSKEYGPGYAATDGSPSITALSFDYDTTGNLSRLGSGNRS